MISSLKSVFLRRCFTDGLIDIFIIVVAHGKTLVTAWHFVVFAREHFEINIIDGLFV